jgi:quercetin dioxygenase-like cupin family protein
VAEGRVLDNPITGERIIIRQTSAETGGELLVFDVILPPGGHVPATHVHPRQQETFQVLEGIVRFRVGRRSVTALAGERVVVDSGTAHWFGNPGNTPAMTRVEVRPALHMQELLERNSAISSRTSVFALAQLLLDFQLEIAAPLLPSRLVRALLLPVVWLARSLR